MTAVPLATPTLATARLVLRPFADADAVGLFALHSKAHVLRYWDSPPWSERERAERFVTASRRIAEEGTGVRLAIDEASDGRFIGWCSLTGWNPDHRSAALAYILDDTAWGHGFATEAVRALLFWAFDALDLNRIQAATDTRNAASARVLQKLGFELEGTLRQDCIVNGEVSDSFVFGLIRQDWTAQVTTSRLLLKPLVASTAAALASDRRLAAALLEAELPQAWPHPAFLDVIRDRTSGSTEAEHFGVWAIVDRAEATVVGDIGFKGPPDAAGTVEIGYSVLAEMRGRGYAAEATDALVHWALSRPCVRAIVANCAPDNAASIRTLERAGFTKSGESGGEIQWRIADALMSTRTIDAVADKVRTALASANLEQFAELLHPKVTWGAPGDPSPSCQSRQQVLAWLDRSRGDGRRTHVRSVTTHGDKILVAMTITSVAGDAGADRWQVLTVADGRITDIRGYDREADAQAAVC